MIRKSRAPLVLVCLILLGGMASLSFYAQSSDLIHAVAYTGNPLWFQLVLLLGADINRRATTYVYGPCTCHPATVPGDTSLNVALRGAINEGHDCRRMLDLMIEHGAMAQIENQQGLDPPLCLAVEWGDKNFVRQLLSHGALLEATSSWGPPLVIAIACEKRFVADLLLEKGANIESRDRNGRTALHWAALNRDLEMIQKLIDRGAVLGTRDKDGKTPFDLAYLFGRGRVIEELIPPDKRSEWLTSDLND